MFCGRSTDVRRREHGRAAERARTCGGESTYVRRRQHVRSAERAPTCGGLYLYFLFFTNYLRQCACVPMSVYALKWCQVMQKKKKKKKKTCGGQSTDVRRTEHGRSADGARTFVRNSSEF